MKWQVEIRTGEFEFKTFEFLASTVRGAKMKSNNLFKKEEEDATEMHLKMYLPDVNGDWKEIADFAPKTKATFFAPASKGWRDTARYLAAGQGIA